MSDVDPLLEHRIPGARQEGTWISIDRLPARSHDLLRLESGSGHHRLKIQHISMIHLVRQIRSHILTA